MPCHSDDLRSNHLLGALPEEDLRALEPLLELVRVRDSQLLCEAGVPATYMYFPTTAVMSLLHLKEDGAIVEIAAVGREGMVGVQALAGGGSLPGRVEVRSGGMAYRIAVHAIRKECDRSMGIYRVMVLYMQALMTQIAQSALCTKHHSIRQQLCRWLLVAHDQLASDELSVTQQMIANMLGVRREGVTQAAGKLHDAALIRQRRGRITVVNRPGLEDCACECYSMIRRELGRLLPREHEVAASGHLPQALATVGKPLSFDSQSRLLQSS